VVALVYCKLKNRVLIARNHFKDSSKRHLDIDILFALVRGSARGGIGTDNPADLRSGSSRFDGFAAVPGKRRSIGGRGTSIRNLRADNHTLGASALVGDGPLGETVRGAVNKVSGPFSISRYEFGLAITMGFTLSIELNDTAVAPVKTVSFGLQGDDGLPSLGVKLTLGGG
jgi:hypothetical protein